MAPKCYLYSINKILYTYIYLPNIQFLMLCLIVTPCSGYPRIVFVEKTICTIY